MERQAIEMGFDGFLTLRIVFFGEIGFFRLGSVLLPEQLGS